MLGLAATIVPSYYSMLRSTPSPPANFQLPLIDLGMPNFSPNPGHVSLAPSALVNGSGDPWSPNCDRHTRQATFSPFVTHAHVQSCHGTRTLADWTSIVVLYSVPVYDVIVTLPSSFSISRIKLLYKNNIVYIWSHLSHPYHNKQPSTPIHIIHHELSPLWTSLMSYHSPWTMDLMICNIVSILYNLALGFIPN